MVLMAMLVRKETLVVQAKRGLLEDQGLLVRVVPRDELELRDDRAHRDQKVHNYKYYKFHTHIHIIYIYI